MVAKFGKIIHENIGNNAVISLYIIGGIIGGLSYMALFNIIPYYDKIYTKLLIKLFNSAIAYCRAYLYREIIDDEQLRNTKAY